MRIFVWLCQWVDQFPSHEDAEWLEILRVSILCSIFAALAQTFLFWRIPAFASYAQLQSGWPLADLFHALYHTLREGPSAPVHMQNDSENEIHSQDNDLLHAADYANCPTLHPLCANGIQHSFRDKIIFNCHGLDHWRFCLKICRLQSLHHLFNLLMNLKQWNIARNSIMTYLSAWYSYHSV